MSNDNAPTGADTEGVDVAGVAGEAAAERPYRIVVGVSAHTGSPTALAWAAEELAARGGGELVAVRAWKMPTPQTTPTAPTAGRPPTQASLQEENERALAQDVSDVLGPDHGARLEVVRGGKRQALLDAAKDADLLVVDAPRAMTDRPFAGRLVYAAACPVVVMPPRISGEPPTSLARAAAAIGRNALRGAGTAGRPGYRPA